MHGSIAPVDIYWLISEHRQLVNEHDQTVLKLAVAETEAANLRRQLAECQMAALPWVDVYVHAAAATEYWIPVSNMVPPNQDVVLAVIEIEHQYPPAKTRQIVRAWHVTAKSVEPSSDGWSEDLGEYDEEKDTYYLPEGWYEDCPTAGYYYHIEFATVTHWLPLPDMPPPSE